MTARGASQFELKAIPRSKAAPSPEGHYDVVILGGGLAGLTLSLHLKRERPETSVLLVDKRETPAREAAFKVGRVDRRGRRVLPSREGRNEGSSQRAAAAQGGVALLLAGWRQQGHIQADRIRHA